MTASAQLPPMRGGIAGATAEAGAYGGSRAAPPYPQVSSATVFRRFHVQRWPGCVSKRFAKGVESGEIQRNFYYVSMHTSGKTGGKWCKISS